MQNVCTFCMPRMFLCDLRQLPDIIRKFPYSCLQCYPKILHTFHMNIQSCPCQFYHQNEGSHVYSVFTIYFSTRVNGKTDNKHENPVTVVRFLRKVKVKLPLFKPWRHTRGIEVTEVQFHSFLTLTLDECEWPVSLDILEKTRSPTSVGIQHLTVQPTA
jgi:hypothetical protein